MICNRKVELPSQFDDLKSVIRLIALLSPHIVNKSISILKEGPISKEIQVTTERYVKIFIENSVKKRVAFFSEPLIRHLWGLFTVQSPNTFTNYLRKLKYGSNDGRFKLNTLVTDIKETEILTGLKIIP